MPGVYEMAGLAPGKYILQTNNSSNGTMQGSTEVDLANDGQELDLSAAGPAATVKMTCNCVARGLAAAPLLGAARRKRHCRRALPGQ